MGSSPEEMLAFHLEDGERAIKDNLKSVDLSQLTKLHSVAECLSQGRAYLNDEGQRRIGGQLLSIIEECFEKGVVLDSLNPNLKSGRPNKENEISQRTFAVGRLILDKGFSRNKAYKEVAKIYSVSPTTIRTQYLAREKKAVANGRRRLP